MKTYKVYWNDYDNEKSVQKSKTVKADWAHVENPERGGAVLTFHRNVDGDPSDLVAAFRSWEYFEEVANVK